MSNWSLPVWLVSVWSAVLCWSPAPAAAQSAAPDFAPEQVTFFEQQVLPILRSRCFACHGGESEVEGGFRITSRAGIVTGGELGAAFDAENPSDSELLAAINYESVEMPPSGKLPDAEIEVLSRWVRLGLPWSSVADYGVAPAARQDTRGDGRDYWAYQPLVRPEVPEVADRQWVQNPVDAFILARLQAAQLSPAPTADKLTLIRRAYYDLTGLPPASDEVDRFVEDSSPRAFEGLVDRLLESPQYGERWGRHWLDCVRYAESHGYERDSAKPHAWRYRDYVIRSFNEDKPYDQFVTEQLAGDEMSEVTCETLTATGYYRLGIWDDEPVDRELARFDGLDDIVKTTSEVVLGTTMGCVRCHAHKADPIEHHEYYQFLAYFRDISYPNAENLRFWATEQDRAEHEGRLREKTQREEQLAAEITAIESEFHDLARATLGEGADAATALVEQGEAILGPAKIKRLGELREQLAAGRKRQLPPPGTPIMAVAEQGRAPVHVLIRGNPHAPEDLVEPGVPSALRTSAPVISELPADGPTSGKRLALARWMFQSDNPLTARVLANRIWQHHFGRGIVPTPNDFGKLGEPPTHPELLDWLACEIRDGGWQLKRIHKLIMRSAAWQMSSLANADGLAKDPGNWWLWRFNMRRLSSEEIRDSMLAVTGELNLKQGGPSIFVPIPQAVLAGQSRPGAGWGKSAPEEAARRSVYIHVKRSLLVPILEMHDQADTDSSCPVRYVTTVPTQSLSMLNGEFTNEKAGKLADRLVREFPDNVKAQVRRATRLTTGRKAAAEEVNRDVHFVRALVNDEQLTIEQALRTYCLMMLNTNEFVYLD